MNRRTQYDFFGLGQQHANDEIQAIKELAAYYEKKFGGQARKDFESGVASAFPHYSRSFIITSEEEKISPDGATMNYGEPNTRNNSYFGGQGYGVQYYYDEQGVKRYNDPQKSSRGK